MGLDLLVEVTDREGKVLQRISAPSRSFVRQWYDAMTAQFDNRSQTIKDTGGATTSASPHAYTLRVKPTVATETRFGHRVGKGTTAVTISDYALGTPLEEGTGLDNFEHQAVTYGKPAVVGSTCSFWLRRSMFNGSGSTITGIKEIGLYAYCSASKFMLAVRDVIPSGVSVPDGGAITVTYTFKVTV